LIKKKGSISVVGGVPDLTELNEALGKLKDGDYMFVIAKTDEKNRALNKLAYLHSVVLRTIAEKLAERNPDEDPVSPQELYRYFEEKFAPIHTCRINGEEFDYLDLKSEHAVDVGTVTEKIVRYAEKKLGIHIPTEEDLNTEPYFQLYAEAYLNQWKGYWSEFLSRRKNKD
jgi:hypothetical protein